MAIVVEDGTGLANSVSYVTADEARAYALARGVVLAGDDTAVEAMLVSAADYLEMYSTQYKGTQLKPTQGLSWPRSGVVINGNALPDNEIPKQLKRAQSQLVIESTKGDLVVSNHGGKFIKKKQIGPIVTEFSEAVQLAQGGETIFPLVDGMLELLFTDTGGAALRSYRI